MALTLSYPKTDLIPVPVGADATRYIAALEWNTLCQVVDNNRLFNVKDYGAIGNGVADDSSAIQAAIAAAGTASTHGGVIFFPAGRYSCASPINLKDSRGIRLLGAGGGGVGGGGGTARPASVLVYTGTGTTPFLQMNSAQYDSIEQLGVTYNSASFTGVLIDFSWSTSNLDAAANIIANCYLGTDASTTIWSAKALISFDKADSCRVTNCHLAFAQAGIRFREANTGYSNAHLIDFCLFHDFQTAACMNAGQGCSILANTFENNFTVGGGATMFRAYYDDLPSNGASNTNWATALSFSDNWVGDGDQSVPIFDNNATSIFGLTMRGNVLGGNIRLNSIVGGKITANQVGASPGNPTLTFAGTFAGLEISGNAVTAGAWTMSGFPTSGVTYFDNPLQAGTQAPNAVAGAGAGTGPTVTLSADATDRRGTITVLTGTSPSAGGNVFSINYGTPYKTAARVVLFPENAVTAALSGTTALFYAPSAGSFTTAVSSGALAATTTYKWTYVVTP